MNETFRISQTHLRRQPLWFGLVIVLVVALVAGQFWNDEAMDIASTVLFGVAVLAIATFAFVRTHREMKMYAANHVLVLTDDAILLRDGATERRIPYSAIERLKIRQPLFGDRYFLVKCSGLTEDKFYGYESVERLLSALIAKLPPDRVKGTRVHA